MGFRCLCPGFTVGAAPSKIKWACGVNQVDSTDGSAERCGVRVPPSPQEFSFFHEILGRAIESGFFETFEIRRS